MTNKTERAVNREAVQTLMRLRLLTQEHADKLSRLTVDDLKKMDGQLPDNYVGDVTPIINQQLDRLKLKAWKEAARSYIAHAILVWTNQLKTGQDDVPEAFLDTWADMSETQQQTVGAQFYLEALKHLYETLFIKDA